MQQPEELPAYLLKAIADYRYLLENAYPQKGIVKLVGDRYQLSKTERGLLYRGITTKHQEKVIKPCLAKKPQGHLIIDGYNVLFTLLSYRTGNLVFISTDGLCRDAGLATPKIPNMEMLTDCIEQLMDYLNHQHSEKITIFLDKPVPGSAKHQEIIQKLIAIKSLNGSCELTASADELLLRTKANYLATSDSEIIKAKKIPVIDIPHSIVTKQFQGSLLNLQTIVL